MTTPTVPLFKSRIKFFSIISTKGRFIRFTNGRFFTQDPELISFLQAEAEKRGAGIYIDPQEPTVDPKGYDPLAKVKEKLRAELKAEALVEAAKERVALKA